MKCINCGSEWSATGKASVSITNCPFCGENPVVKKEAKKSCETSREALGAIYKQFGADILLGKLNAYIADFAPSLSTANKRLVNSVYEFGASKALKESINGTQEDKERAVKIAIRNMTEAFVAPEMAENIVYEFTNALDWKIEKSKQQTDVAKMKKKDNKEKEKFISKENKEETQKIEMVRFTAPDANILIFFESAIIRTNISKMLQEYNIKINTCENQEKAIEEIKIKNYDLIIIEYNMRKVNTDEFLQTIREKCGGDLYFKNLPIITYISNNSKLSVLNFLKKGGTDYLFEPIAEDMFNAKIVKYLSKEKIKK
jgi:PleD family two-component response regulator